MKSRFVYGPVPSRRLGLSLGVDLVPFKTCTYDCIYCRLGRTTNRTIELDEYVSVDGVLAGITDSRQEVERIATIVDKMRRIDRVQLNTVARPPAEASAFTVAADDLEKLRGFFSCPCEIIAETRRRRPAVSSDSENTEDRIVALLSRRPCTIDGIATGLGLRPNEVLKYLEALCARGTILTERRGDAVFYDGAHELEEVVANLTRKREMEDLQ